MEENQEVAGKKVGRSVERLYRVLLHSGNDKNNQKNKQRPLLELLKLAQKPARHDILQNPVSIERRQWNQVKKEQKKVHNNE